jgi:antitoxin VapB
MDELKVKKDRVYRLLENKKLDGLILVRNSNIAWLADGMENKIVYTSEEGAIKLIVLKDKILVLTNNIEAERIIEEERLGEKDFQFTINQWFEKDLLDDLTGDYHLGADCYLPRVNNLQEEIKQLRFSLLPGEIKRYTILGKETSKIVSKICKNIIPGETENEVRGRLAQNLWSKNINPHLILIGSDERIFTYRHPIPKDKKIRKYVMVVVCAERDGLIVNMTRFVHFGLLPQELKEKLYAVAKVDASFILNTKIGVKVADIFQNAISTYKEVGYPDEWKFHHQGGAAGYETRDYIATPDSLQIVQPNQAFTWNPSIKGAKSEDTILIIEKGYEIITEDSNWPKIEINYKGEKVFRPAILQL